LTHAAALQNFFGDLQGNERLFFLLFNLLGLVVVIWVQATGVKTITSGSNSQVLVTDVRREDFKPPESVVYLATFCVHSGIEISQIKGQIIDSATGNITVLDTSCEDVDIIDNIAFGEPGSTFQCCSTAWPYTSSIENTVGLSIVSGDGSGVQNFMTSRLLLLDTSDFGTKFGEPGFVEKLEGVYITSDSTFVDNTWGLFLPPEFPCDEDVKGSTTTTPAVTVKNLYTKPAVSMNTYVDTVWSPLSFWNAPARVEYEVDISDESFASVTNAGKVDSVCESKNLFQIDIPGLNSTTYVVAKQYQLLWTMLPFLAPKNIMVREVTARITLGQSFTYTLSIFNTFVLLSAFLYPTQKKDVNRRWFNYNAFRSFGWVLYCGGDVFGLRKEKKKRDGEDDDDNDDDDEEEEDGARDDGCVVSEEEKGR
jgi:hypothetical protein